MQDCRQLQIHTYPQTFGQAAPEQRMALTPPDFSLREKCRLLGSEMRRLQADISRLERERDRAHQEWHRITNTRHNSATEGDLAALKSEQNRLKGLEDQHKADIRRANDALDALRNDWEISRCNLL